MAQVFGLPVATHNTGSQLHTWATCQWAASIRDYLACETITGQGQQLAISLPFVRLNWPIKGRRAQVAWRSTRERLRKQIVRSGSVYARPDVRNLRFIG